MPPLPTVDVAAFRENGYVLVKGVFEEKEIQELRDRVRSARELDLSASNAIRNPVYPNCVDLLGDLLSKTALRSTDYVIFDERVVRCAKECLGPRLVYFGDSSIQTGEGARGFHKDNVDRSDGTGPDWQGDYTVLRIGIYLQDHARHSGGLKVRRRSHRYVSRHRGGSLNVDSERGDLVLWNLRTSHSGNAVRLKGWPGLSLPPRVETRIPSFLRVPPQDERMAIFCTFGAPGAFVDRYIEDQVKREDSREHWRRSRVDESLRELATRRGIEIRTPIAEYGSLSRVS
jgi:hypothetical protein